MAAAATLLVACDEAPPTQGTPDTGSTQDTTDDAATPDVADVAEDTAVDTEPDTVDATPEVTDTVDEEVADVAVDTDVTEPDAADVEVGPDTGTDCSEDDSVCEDPYACIEGVCRVPMAGTAWAEADFDIVEPEELVRAFDFLKNFASDVRFFVIDVEDGDDGYPTTYGAADEVDEEVSPIQVTYQLTAVPDGITLRPRVDDEMPLDGLGWVSDVFDYSLRAYAVVEFPTLDPVETDFGIDAIDTTLDITFSEDDTERAAVVLRGAVTREETEGRSMVSPEQLPVFADFFCEDKTHDPEGMWHLSDVLDCNNAVMDYDADEDGTNDAYIVVIHAAMVPAEIVDP